MKPSNERVNSACRLLAAAGIDPTQLRTVVVGTATRDESAIRLIALFGALRQGDLTVLFGVSKVTTSRLVTRLIATERLHALPSPDHTRGRPATWLLLPGTMLPSSVERQAIVALVNDAAIVLQVDKRDVQLPTYTTTASAEDTSAAPTASAPPHCGPADRPIPPQKDASQLELPELAEPDNWWSDLPLQIDAAYWQQPRSSAVPPRVASAAASSAVGSPRSDPFPASQPTTRMDGDVPIECPPPVCDATAPPPSWPAIAGPVCLDRGTALRPLSPWETATAGTTPRQVPCAHQPARGRTSALPPWQRPSSRTHVYVQSIIRSICAWHAAWRIGGLRITLGHRFSAAGHWLLLHFGCIGRGLWCVLGCIGRGIWRVMRWLGGVIGWMTQCIALLYELTDRRIWPAMVMIALPIAGSMMFSLVHSINLMPVMELAPVSAPPPTRVLTPTAGFRWARVVGTERVGLLIRDVPNGKRRLGDGLREGATVTVIAGPVTTADTQNPIWWQVRHNSVTGWVSGRFLTFTDQAP